MPMPVRLSAAEIDAIVESVRAVISNDILESIDLYGSRANRTAKGGDIDLWIFCSTEKDIDTKWIRSIRMKIQQRIGEQKIDIVLSGPTHEIEDVRKKAFLEHISSGRVNVWKKNNQP